MSVIENPPRGKFLNRRHCFTGDPALATWGRKAQIDFNHLRNWRAGSGMVAAYIGRPVESENGDPTNGTTGGFHIITGFPVREDTADRRMIIAIKLWRWGFDDGGAPPAPLTEAWSWYKDAGDGAAADTWSYATQLTTVTNDDYTTGANGSMRRFDVDVAPTAANDGFRMSRLDCNYAMVAALSVFAVPDAATLSPDQAMVLRSDVAVGQVLSGYSDSVGSQESIGALVHHVDSGDSMIHATRRALFNHPYVLGAWGEASVGWTSFRTESVSGVTRAATYRVKPRNLDNGSGNIECDVALSLTADNTAKIRLVSSVDQWTYTSGGDAAALITTSSGTSTNLGAGRGLEIASSNDKIDIQHWTGAGNDIQLHTASLWEPSSGTR